MLLAIHEADSFALPQRITTHGSVQRLDISGWPHLMVDQPDAELKLRVGIRNSSHAQWIEIRRRCDWWTPAQLATVAEALELLGVDAAIIAMLKRAVAIWGDDDRREA